MGLGRHHKRGRETVAEEGTGARGSPAIGRLPDIWPRPKGPGRWREGLDLRGSGSAEALGNGWMSPHRGQGTTQSLLRGPLCQVLGSGLPPPAPSWFL